MVAGGRLIPAYAASLLVALGAVRSVAGLEGLVAVVAGAAALACIDVRHLHFSRVLLHREDLGVAIRALESLARVRLPVEHDLAHRGAIFRRFPRRDGASGAEEKHQCQQRQPSHNDFHLSPL